jgi:protein-S-isoprenylcysteine O-methyltransferase Ste14
MRKALLQILVVLAVMALILFVPAGTVCWPGAWVGMAAMGGGGLLMSLWLKRRDPALLRDRNSLKGQEVQKFDRILLPLQNIILLAWVVLMALDVRWRGAQQMPLWTNLLGGAAIFAGFGLVVRVMRENTFATAIVKHQPERGHTVIDTGPYALVRHPMYAAAFVAYAAIPFALGSWRGLAGVPLAILMLAVRTLFEERLLCRQLPGYSNYRKWVRYRFVPLVW